MQRIYFISDTHFGHANILNFTDRGVRFSSIEDHDQSIIDNINEIVGRKDYLYHLGDFCWESTAKKQTILAKEVLGKIKCKNIHLILGNHDPMTNDGQPREDFAGLFKSCVTYKVIRIPETTISSQLLTATKRKVILSHYAIRSWWGMHGGSYHLYGHSHATLPENDTRSFDVGVDSAAILFGEYRPVSSLEVCERLIDRLPRTVDGHGIRIKGV
jgi:calcineurin-like phosphoesterase family protein